jgi:hypothetical protein
MTPEVIAELYRVFSSYGVADEISGCSHCVPVKQSHFLATTSRAELSAGNLDNYAFKALTTWGDVTDFKYFLPRLLELVLTDGLDAFNFPEVLFGKLDYARWFDWPPVERRTIQTFLTVFWCKQLELELVCQEDDSIDTALCALANACRNVDEFLQLWIQSTGPTAVRQLAQFIWLHADRILTTTFPLQGHWHGRPAADEVLAWIKSEDVWQFLQQNSILLTNHLADVLAQLEAIRSATVVPCPDP